MFIRGSWQAARKLNCVSPGSTIFMFELITKVNGAVNSFIWGIPAMICIIGVGLYLSIRTGFIQIRRFVYAIKQTLGKIFEKKEAEKGAMTPFQAVCTALAGTVGTGNIAGVAGAIAIGGPGAVFWMWISALLGMCTKFSEVVLAVHFRERNEEGDWVAKKMAFPGGSFLGLWYGRRVRNRQRDPGQYNRDSY